MRTVLRISLMLNLALLAVVVFVFTTESARHGNNKAKTAPAQAENATQSGKADTTAPLQILTHSEAAPFRWKQLYDPDYRNYVKNLRGVGCPEGTVRAIVTADVNAAFSFRTKEIEQQISDWGNSAWTNQVATFKDQTQLKAQLQNMPDQEAAEIADLLGFKPVPETTAQPSRRVRQVLQAGPVTQPLVLQNIDLSALNLTEEQKQAITTIRQDFLKQIGGANQDPSDPAYLARWQQAQPAADDLLKAYLGGDGFADYEVLAAQKTLEDQSHEQQQQ